MLSKENFPPSSNQDRGAITFVSGGGRGRRGVKVLLVTFFIHGGRHSCITAVAKVVTIVLVRVDNMSTSNTRSGSVTAAYEKRRVGIDTTSLRNTDTATSSECSAGQHTKKTEHAATQQR